MPRTTEDVRREHRAGARAARVRRRRAPRGCRRDLEAPHEAPGARRRRCGDRVRARRRARRDDAPARPPWARGGHEGAGRPLPGLSTAADPRARRGRTRPVRPAPPERPRVARRRSSERPSSSSRTTAWGSRSRSRSARCSRSFPSVILLVGLLGLIGAYEDLKTFLGTVAPGAVIDAIDLAQRRPPGTRRRRPSRS